MDDEKKTNTNDENRTIKDGDKKRQGKTCPKAGDLKMATQIAATPLLKGEDAKQLLEQISKPLSAEQKAKLEERRKRFENIKKRDLE